MIGLRVTGKGVPVVVNRELATKLMQVDQMPTALKEGLIAGCVALPIALRLHQMSDTEAGAALCALLNELDLSLNRQREPVFRVRLHRAIIQRPAIGVE